MQQPFDVEEEILVTPGGLVDPETACAGEVVLWDDWGDHGVLSRGVPAVREASDLAA